MDKPLMVCPVCKYVSETAMADCATCGAHGMTILLREVVPAAELAALRAVEKAARTVLDDCPCAECDALRAALDKLAAARGEGGGK